VGRQKSLVHLRRSESAPMHSVRQGPDMLMLCVLLIQCTQVQELKQSTSNASSWVGSMG
jgi:hypothetical protein